MAIEIPPSVMVLIMMPNQSKTMIVIMIESGMASTEMNVVLKFHKNKKITATTRRAPSRSAERTLLMETVIKSDCLKIFESMITPGGRVF